MLANTFLNKSFFFLGTEQIMELWTNSYDFLLSSVNKVSLRFGTFMTFAGFNPPKTNFWQVSPLILNKKNNSCIIESSEWNWGNQMTTALAYDLQSWRWPWSWLMNVTIRTHSAHFLSRKQETHFHSYYRFIVLICQILVNCILRERYKK